MWILFFHITYAYCLQSFLYSCGCTGKHIFPHYVNFYQYGDHSWYLGLSGRYFRFSSLFFFIISSQHVLPHPIRNKYTHLMQLNHKILLAHFGHMNFGFSFSEEIFFLSLSLLRMENNMADLARNGVYHRVKSKHSQYVYARKFDLFITIH